MNETCRHHVFKVRINLSFQCKNRIAHIGIAVKDLNEAIQRYISLPGLHLEKTAEVAERGLKIAFFSAGEISVELLAPLSENSEIAGFLKRRGEGVHHIAISTCDLRGDMQKLRECGIIPISDRPSVGAEGYPVVFYHPKDFNGVLFELMEKND